MELFDDGPRTGTDPKPEGESDFAYLNRTGRADLAPLRDEIEGWFANYPASDRDDFQARFRSADDHQHLSAYWELFVHEMLRRLDCEMVPHPTLSGTAKRPEFLVTEPSGERFYIEAILATGESNAEVATKKREAVVYDALNDFESPNFWLGIDVRGGKQSSPPVRQIKAFLRKRLDQLDPDEVENIEAEEGLEGLPTWPFFCEGWEITFTPMAKPQELRGQGGVETLGIKTLPWRVIKTWEAVRNAVQRKATRYGELDLPYVIAVDVLGIWASDAHVVDGLFGERQTTFTRWSNGQTTRRDHRAGNGAWLGPKGAKNTRVSAVLAGRQIVPTHRERGWCLYHHPWAARRYAGTLLRLPHADVNGEGTLTSEKGLEPTDLFGSAVGDR